MKTFYLCDGLRSCLGSAGCAYRKEDPGPCMHTTDPDHALNGKCEQPGKFPGRFYLSKFQGKESYWEEGVV